LILIADRSVRFDIHPTIYSHVLFFYTRYTDDLNAALAFYKKMQAANKVTDPVRPSLILVVKYISNSLGV